MLKFFKLSVLIKANILQSLIFLLFLIEPLFKNKVKFLFLGYYKYIDSELQIHII